MSKLKANESQYEKYPLQESWFLNIQYRTNTYGSNNKLKYILAIVMPEVVAELTWWTNFSVTDQIKEDKNVCSDIWRKNTDLPDGHERHWQILKSNPTLQFSFAWPSPTFDPESHPQSPVFSALLQVLRLLKARMSKDLPIKQSKGWAERSPKLSLDGVNDLGFMDVHKPQQTSLIVQQDTHAVRLTH